MTMTEILLLQSIYSVAIVLLEIPTGAIGDYFGKKISISTGALLFFIGMSIYSIGASFSIFLVAELIAAIGSSMISGSDSAFIHNSLKNAGREKSYKKVEGNANAFLLTGFLVAGLIGGFISKFSLRFTIISTAISAFIVFFVSLFFKEPKVKTKKKKESYKELILGSVKIMSENKPLLWLFVYSSILTAISLVLSWYYQLFFVKVKVDVMYFGGLYAILGIVAIFSSKYAHQVESYIGKKGTLIFLGILVTVTPLLLAKLNSILAISLFALHQIYIGISKIIYNDIILAEIPSSRSATILSINNLGSRFFFAMISPVFGYITDVYSLNFTLMAMGIFALSVLTISIFMYFFVFPRRIYC